MKKPPKYIFEIDWASFDAALSDFHALVELSFGDIHLANVLSSFGDSGSPFITAHIDRSVAKMAGYNLVRYQIANDLLVYLTTARTRNIQSENV